MAKKRLRSRATMFSNDLEWTSPCVAESVCFKIYGRKKKPPDCISGVFSYSGQPSNSRSVVGCLQAAARTVHRRDPLICKRSKSRMALEPCADLVRTDHDLCRTR